MPIKIDLIGKNKIPVFARFFDFEKTPQYLKNDLFDLDYLQKAFEQSKGFLVSSEPDKEQFHFQHIAWNHFRNSSTLEYIDSKEVERIREYAVEHGVKPW